MRNDHATLLTGLAQRLELRWRLGLLVAAATDAVAVSLAASVIFMVAQLWLGLEVPTGLVLMAFNGTALVIAIASVAVRRRNAELFLIDADRAYGQHALLVSAYEFARNRQGGPPRDEQRAAFEGIVVDSAARRIPHLDPRAVYPVRTPRRIAVAAALFAGLGTLILLDTAGLFERAEPTVSTDQMMLEDATRRLAARARDNEALADIVEELRRLGEVLRQDGPGPEEARRRIEALEERIEAQIRDLERAPAFAADERTEIPEEAEASIRAALRAGMESAEVLDFFARMRSEGSTMPDIVEALEQATPDRPPDTVLGLDEAQVRALIEELNRPDAAEDADSQIVDDLRESRRIVQQAGSGLTDLSEGSDTRAGPAEEAGVGRDRTATDAPHDTGPPDGAPGAGQAGGTAAVDDEPLGRYREPEEWGPVFTKLTGIVTEGTIMDLIVRELPSEATSRMTEEDLVVEYERVIEEVVAREAVAPEMRPLVRNYFLILTRGEWRAADER